MFSSKSFIISHPTFRSLVHFEFIRLVGSILILFFYTEWSSFLAPLTEETIFSPLCILASFVKDKKPIGAWVSLCTFCLAPLACYFGFCARAMVSW